MIRSSRTIRNSSRQPKKSKRHSNHNEESDNDHEIDEEIDDDPFNSRVEYFHAERLEEEEAEEGEEDDEEIDNEAENNHGNYHSNDVPGTWASKDKKTRKICRHFSYDLIDRALRYEWEPEMLCELIHVISKELNFDFVQIKKLIEKSRIGTPILLAQLADKGTRFTVSELCSILLNASSSMSDFIRLMGDALEMQLIRLEATDTIATLCSFPIWNMSNSELLRYAVALCEHCRTKVVCGKILEQITSKLEVQAAAEVIVDVITLDFFPEIKGTMKDCLGQLTRAREEVEMMLDDGYERRPESGDIIESDEDSEGNLRGFIASEGSASEDENELIEEDEELLSPLPSEDELNDSDDNDHGSSRNYKESKRNVMESPSRKKEKKKKDKKKKQKKDREVKEEINQPTINSKKTKRKRNFSEDSDEVLFEERTEQNKTSQNKRLKKNTRDHEIKEVKEASNEMNVAPELDQQKSHKKSKSSKHDKKEKEVDRSLSTDRKEEPEETIQSPANSSNLTKQQRKWLKFREKKKQIKIDKKLEPLESSNIVSYPSDQEEDDDEDKNVLVDSDED